VQRYIEMLKGCKGVARNGGECRNQQRPLTEVDDRESLDRLGTRQCSRPEKIEKEALTNRERRGRVEQGCCECVEEERKKEERRERRRRSP
jgi:hypothetical protein